MAQVIRYVDPDAAGAGTGVDWTNAYTSLSAWNAAEATNLVTAGNYHTVYCRSSGGTADTTAATVGTGWTTDATHYIEIIGADFPADGVFDATKYRLYNPNASTAALTISENYVRVISLQVLVDVSGGSARYGVYVASIASGGSDIRLDSCIIKGGSQSGTAGAYGLYSIDADATITVYNTTITGFISSDVPADNSFTAIYIIGGVLRCYNCTIYGNYYGINRLGGTVTATNCAVGNNTDDFNGTITIDHCCSDDGDGTNTQTPSGGAWTNEFTNAAGGDFSLLAGGNCVGHGTDNPGSGLYSDDIIGTVRSSTWDIGAYEYAAGGDGGTTHEAAGIVSGQSSLTAEAKTKLQFAEGTITAQSSSTAEAKLRIQQAMGTVSGVSAVTGIGSLIRGGSSVVIPGSGNDFASDANCVGLYDAEGGWPNYYKDAQAANDWLVYPRVNTTDYREGDGCLEVTNDTGDTFRPSGLEIDDADLGVGWPGKAGTANKTVSAVFWVKAHDVPSTVYFHNIIAKGAGVTPSALAWGVQLYDSRFHLTVGNLYNWAGTVNTVLANTWYHVGVTLNGADNSYRIRVYDTSSGTNWSDATGTLATGMSVNAESFKIGMAEGSYGSALYSFDGQIDDVAVFNDVLTANEIDACRAGTHNYGTDANCVAHWSFDTTNFLTDDIGGLTYTNGLVTCPVQQTAVVRFGSAAFELFGQDRTCGYILDSALTAGYPFKNGTANTTWSAAFWFRMKAVPGSHAWLVTKYLNDTVGSAGVRIVNAASTSRVQLKVRYGVSSGDDYTHTSALVTNRWYHLGVVVDSGANTYRLRLWDDVAETVTDVNGPLLHDPIVSDRYWSFGGGYIITASYALNGYLDEIVMFNDALTADEIDDIRKGEYGNTAAPDWQNTYGALYALSTASAHAVQTHASAGALSALATLVAAIQVKVSYVPANVLMDPYPIPMLWQYLRAGVSLEEGVGMWAARVSQWCEEHMTRAYREINRIGAEKTQDWVDV